jgi:hypothetical protein
LRNATRLPIPELFPRSVEGEAGRTLAALVALAGVIFLLVGAFFFVEGKDLLRAELAGTAGLASFAIARHVRAAASETPAREVGDVRE